MRAGRRLASGRGSSNRVVGSSSGRMSCRTRAPAEAPRTSSASRDRATRPALARHGLRHQPAADRSARRRCEHDRTDHGAVVFDHIRIDASYTFDSDPMPMLVVVDVLHGRHRVRPRRRHRPGARRRLGAGGRVGHAVLRRRPTSPSCAPRPCRCDVLLAAIEEADPEHPGERLIFTSYVPRSPAAGARWRATVDQVSSMLPADATAAQEEAAARLLGHTLLHTFANNVVVRADARPASTRDDLGRLALDRAPRRAHHRGARVGGAHPRRASPASAT